MLFYKYIFQSGGGGGDDVVVHIVVQVATLLEENVCTPYQPSPPSARPVINWKHAQRLTAADSNCSSMVYTVRACVFIVTRQGVALPTCFVTSICCLNYNCFALTIFSMFSIHWGHVSLLLVLGRDIPWSERLVWPRSGCILPPQYWT